jgi:hypothetical protein
VHPRGRESDRRVPGEQLEQFRVIRAEHPALVSAEHHAGADDPPAPLQRDADDPAQRGALGRADVTALHLVVPVEPDRPAPGHHGPRHPLAEREDLARLARDADVGLLAVGPGGLVDAADRPGGTAEQFRAAQQDALQQRAQRELPGQVLRDGDQPGGAGGGIGRNRDGGSGGREDGQPGAAPVPCGPAVGGHSRALRICDSAVAAGRSRGGLL